MKPSPAGWPRISSSLWYEDPKKAIDWLCRAFGFEVKLKVEGEDGRIEHSELTYGEGLIMVGGEGPYPKRPGTSFRKSPRSLEGANTQNIFIYVDEVDAHCERARAVGGKILSEPTTTDHGEGYWADRSYEVMDLEGHRWWFAQRMRG